MKLLTIGGPAVEANLALGVQAKPASCRLLCPYYSVGSGFSADVLPLNTATGITTAKIMIMISNPSRDDIVNRRLLSGKAGWSFFKQYVFPLGYKQEDVAVCAVIRCSPRGGKFPLGRDKKMVMESCRHHDQGAIKAFGPNMYIIAHDVKLSYSEPVYSRLIRADIARAFKFAEKGFKPIVLLGNEATELCAPFIVGDGGTKTWHSHYDFFSEGTWPHLSVNKEPKAPQGFTPARY